MTTVPVLGGTVPPDSDAYVTRAFEQECFDLLAARHWVLLLGPRQHGKSSGLVRLQRMLDEGGIRTARVDFQSFGGEEDYPALLRWICARLADEFELELSEPPAERAHDLAAWLDANVPPGQGALGLLFDEAGAVPDRWKNQFYSQLRSLYNSRGTAPPTSAAARAQMLFAGTFRPEKLVTDENSPFNISRDVFSDDLDRDQALELASRLEVPDAERWAAAAYDLVGGQPYLLQLLLGAVRTRPDDASAAFEEALAELRQGRNRHFLALVDRIKGDEELLRIAGALVGLDPVTFVPANADHLFLEVVGLARIDGERLVVRNELYRELLTQLYEQGALAEAPEIEAVEPEVTRGTAARPRQILLVGSEWFSRYGGLSTFNRELAIAFAAAGHRVVCLVPDATPEESTAAGEVGVELVTAPEQSNVDVRERLLLRQDGLPEDFSADVVIGHGRVTGLAAKNLVDMRYPTAARVHFVHTTPEDLEWLKDHPAGEPSSTTAEERTREELGYAQDATLVAAVGPRLFADFQTRLVGVEMADKIHQFLPGLILRSAGEIQPQRIEVLLLGRAEDVQVKGIDLAAKAMAQMEDRARLLARLVVRGSPAAGAEALRDQLRTWSEHRIDVVVRDYTHQPDLLAADIRSSSLLVMPSRAEGFGLAALEAIAFAKPVLVSDASGLGRLIADELSTRAHQFVVPSTGPDGEVIAAWSSAIQTTIDDLDAAVTRARWLRSALEPKLDWAEQVDALLEALDARAALNA